ncbi:MAG: secondary thiamine-phosphate synthase enzyme YjbQ [Methanocellales archaeon]|nr:secondary thiamine-phosphate synthase enzyme YjbQ [Methanocellales archaeon]
MDIITRTLDFQTKGNTDVIDITEDVQRALKETNLKEGIITVFVPGATGAVTTMEYESGLIKDLTSAIERVAPQDIEYKHNLKWGDDNGHSHVRASLVGPSVIIPFSNAKLMLGTWQQIVFIDFDIRPRARKIILQIMGNNQNFLRDERDA